MECLHQPIKDQIKTILLSLQEKILHYLATYNLKIDNNTTSIVDAILSNKESCCISQESSALNKLELAHFIALLISSSKSLTVEDYNTMLESLFLQVFRNKKLSKIKCIIVNALLPQYLTLKTPSQIMTYLQSNPEELDIIINIFPKYKGENLSRVLDNIKHDLE